MNFPKHVDGFPMLYHGVLCANGENNGIGKGRVLEAFLVQIQATKGSQTGGYVPKIIVMADDKQSNLEDAKKILTANYTNIRFIGIKYQGAFEYAPCDISEVDFTKFWETLADQAKLLCLA